jgi:hypothetical protein
LLDKYYEGSNQAKVHNDALIPRTILKRHNPGNLVKDKRLEEATKEFQNYQEEQAKLIKSASQEDFVGKYDALFGRHLKTTNPLLNPKINQIVRASL